MKIIQCNDDVLAKIPNIFQLIFDIFGEKSITLYACLDNYNNLGFIARDGVNYVYINNKGYRLFSVDLEYGLKAYSGKDYRAYFDSNGTIRYKKKKKNEYAISFLPLDGLDDEGYNGEVIFNQYHPDTDMLCQLTYPHMYNEFEGKPRIYSYHTKIPSSIYLEEENSKDHDKRFGIVNKHISNFTRYTFERYMIGYNLILVNEHGLFKTLFNDSYVLEREDKLRRFTKSRFVFNGQFEDLWPFCTLYKQEYINDLVRKNGFMLEVPEEILNINNGYDYMISDIREILEQIKNENLRQSCEMSFQLKR